MSEHHSTKALMERLWRENIRHYKKYLFFAVCCMVFVAGTTASFPLLMKSVINDVFISKDADVLWWISPLVLGIFFLKGLSSYGQTVLMSLVGNRIIADNQSRLYAHLIKMDIQYFHQNSTGGLISRFTVDIGIMRSAVSNVIVSLGRDTLMLIGLVGVLFHTDWLLASIVFFVFPVAILPIVKIGKKMRKVSANTQEEMGRFTTLLEQSFLGIRIVKAYGMAGYESSRLSTIVEKIFKLKMRAERTSAWSSPIMETLGGVAICVVIIYNGNRVISGETTTGDFFAFISALLLAYDPMKKLANLNSAMQVGLAAAQRMFDVLDTQPNILDKPDASPLGAIRGDVQLKNVCFAYEEGKPALNGIDLNAKAGTTVAFVGPSGAGKSTILNLIPRFYDVTSGQILIDGQDVRDVTMASLYENMALVSQEIVLFDDTVRANIAYGRQGASEDEIQSAAKNAAAHDFIMQLTEGYDTIVGEQGVKLSGGQRQRLAIARAMLKNAPILLLDEATSALDTESERKVQAALDQLIEGRTTLVIAHRLSTIVDADVICVVDKGRLIEQGTHSELLKKAGMYKQLYTLQFSEKPTEQPTGQFADEAS